MSITVHGSTITHKTPLIHALNVSSRSTIYLKNSMSSIIPHNRFVGVHDTTYANHIVPVCCSHLFILPVEKLNQKDDHNCWDIAGADHRHWDRDNNKVYPVATINYACSHISVLFMKI